MSEEINNQEEEETFSLEDLDKLIESEDPDFKADMEDLKTKAVERVEQNGIVFLDEIDKVAKRSENSGTDVSREGVQRDLLPL